ncbi:MAG: hypothetical protein IOD12_16785 [Silvanigrellales bacterium]|nr:hypothetical protein [Silvanigrellales bacterium]
MPHKTNCPQTGSVSIRAAVFLVAASLVLTSCEDEAFAESRNGFFLAVGGGASTVEGQATPAPSSPTSPPGLTPMPLTVLKESQVALHRAGLAALADSRRRVNAQGKEPLPSGVCSLEYREPGPDTDDALAISKRLFVAAGAPEASFQGFVFDSRARADDPRLTDQLTRFCGLVSLPGGDQTEMRLLWERTRLHAAMKSLVLRGGGIMGKSAGAALQGTLGYFPETESETTTFSILRGLTFAKREVEPGFFADTVAGIPRFYVETHAGDRERAARALAVLAAWEERKPSKETERALALVVDSDTGVLIRYEPPANAWLAEVVGARAVEALLPTGASASQAGRSGSTSGRGTRWPAYTSVTSHLLLDGARFVLSGPRKGSIVRTSSRVRFAPTADGLEENCGARLDGRIVGQYESDGERNSVVSFDAFDPLSNEYRPSSEVEYAYLTGDLRSRRESGCGFWGTQAFDPDVGRPENRLNALRFALGLGLQGGSFGLALPAGMVARVDDSRGPDGRRFETVTFEADKASTASRETTLERSTRNETEDVLQRPSSVFLYNVAGAAARGVSTYSYSEMGARGPVQTGHWHGGTAHLLPPGSSFELGR